MKYWFIIDDESKRHSEVYIESLPEGSTREDAIDRAMTIWERMTANEQRDCDQLYIGCAEQDEDSDERHIFPDYNTMTEIEYIKK